MIVLQKIWIRPIRGQHLNFGFIILKNNPGLVLGFWSRRCQVVMCWALPTPGLNKVNSQNLQVPTARHPRYKFWSWRKALRSTQTKQICRSVLDLPSNGRFDCLFHTIFIFRIDQSQTYFEVQFWYSTTHMCVSTNLQLSRQAKKRQSFPRS